MSKNKYFQFTQKKYRMKIIFLSFYCNIFLSFYCNIFLSQYCVQKYCVWIGPKREWVIMSYKSLKSVQTFDKTWNILLFSQTLLHPFLSFEFQFKPKWSFCEKIFFSFSIENGKKCENFYCLLWKIISFTEIKKWKYFLIVTNHFWTFFIHCFGTLTCTVWTRVNKWVP